MPKQEAASTQVFVEIDRIYEDVLLLKSGGLRKVLLVSGINTELKSEAEQNLIYLEYQNFLNSLEFSLQAVVHSRKLNIQSYLKMLQERENAESNDLLKNELSEYREFIRSFVAENDIMTKTFLVVVPYDSLNLPSGMSFKKYLPSILSHQKEAGDKTSEPVPEDFRKNLFKLGQRVEHVIAGLQTIGVRAVALNNEELTELFYNLYNPESTEKSGVVFESENG